MQVVRSFPGRIRFDADERSTLAVMRRIQGLNGDGAEVAVRYNPRTGRALATFPESEALTARLHAVITEVLGVPADADGPEVRPRPVGPGVIDIEPEGSAAPGDVADTGDASFDTAKHAAPRRARRRADELPACRTADPGDPDACGLPALSPLLRQDDRLENPFWIIARKVAGHYLTRAFMPMWLRPYWTAFRVAPLLFGGLRALFRGKLNVSVLDAAAVGSSLAMRDFNTAGTIFLLLDVSETLEDWTREKSRSDLTALFRGDDRPVWIMRRDAPISISASQLVEGDLVVVRSGSRIPVDGVVADGTAMVNQSSMTGEPMAVKKTIGAEVYAGTVVEEGKLIILSESVGDETRFAKIAKIISESDELKADIHSHAIALADRIVPFSFLLSGAVFALTRNWMKAASVLLADYSCAIKLATPLSVRAAMLEAARHGALIKGGKYLETLANIDAVVLDKTGTLTEARPEVVDICPIGDYSREFILRNAACMEEHFPHPVAEAVVRKADEEGLVHDERHAEVEYILAHGIATTLHGQRMVLGSKHFVHEDEGIDIEAAWPDIRRCAESGLSTLYMAVGGELAGVIALSDPLRPAAYRLIRRLENMHVRRVIMLTGDNEITARAVAEELGITEYHAQALPDDKTVLIDRLREEGHVVAMVGDGINDSAALTRADVGVSMKHGADIAREACDVMLTGDRLDSLLDAVSISRKAMRRIRRNFVFIVASNTLFIGLGVTGLISPALMALLHNSGTVLTCAHSMRPVLPDHP